VGIIIFLLFLGSQGITFPGSSLSDPIMNWIGIQYYNWKQIPVTPNQVINTGYGIISTALVAFFGIRWLLK
jgi:hypothetical protein